jgi:hypothetical protein
MNLLRDSALIGLLVLAECGCARKTEPAPTESVAPLPSPPPPSAAPSVPSVEAIPVPPPPPVEVPVPGPSVVAAGVSGTMKVEPHPVPVCDKTGLGIAAVKWTIKGTKYAEIRVDAPDGKLFVAAKANGSQKTGPWVRKETVFYLQNGAEGTAENTIARVAAEVVPGGPCP